MPAKVGKMDLQLLDFDCSEDTEGVVSWDALTQALPRYNNALLDEVSQVLAWAYGFDAQGPGALEDGANWDFDLQATLHPDGPNPQSAQLVFDAGHGLVAMQTAALAHPNAQPFTQALAHLLAHPIALSLSLSGTPAFAQAFRERWSAP